MKKRLKIINIFLVLILLGISTMAVFQITKGLKPPSPEAQPVLNREGAKSTTQSIEEWGSYSQTVQGNLFDKSRIPYEPPPTPPPVVVPPPPTPVVTVEPPSIKVNGIIMAGSNTSAIIEWLSAPIEEKKNRILKMGESVGEFTVSEIALGHVIFDSQGEHFTVEKTRGAGGSVASTQNPTPATQEISKGVEVSPTESGNGQEEKAARRGTLIESSKKLAVPEGHEVYFTPVGPSIRKIKPEGEESKKKRANPNQLFGKGSGTP